MSARSILKPLLKAMQLSFFDRMSQPTKDVLVHEASGKTHMQKYHVSNDDIIETDPRKKYYGISRKSALIMDLRDRQKYLFFYEAQRIDAAIKRKYDQLKKEGEMLQSYMSVQRNHEERPDLETRDFSSVITRIKNDMSKIHNAKNKLVAEREMVDSEIIKIRSKLDEIAPTHPRFNLPEMNITSGIAWDINDKKQMKELMRHWKEKNIIESADDILKRHSTP